MDRGVILRVLALCGLALEYATPQLKEDKEVVLAAVAQEGLALQFASTEIKSDKDLVRIAKCPAPNMHRLRLHCASAHGFVATIISFRDMDALEELLMSKTDGNTPLHHAATNGHLGACKALVAHLGSRAFVRNDARKTPQDLARTKPKSPVHVEVVEYFDELKNVFRTGGGNGSALDAALADSRCVTRVGWCKIPLPGFMAGVFHSLLVVTVSDSLLRSETGGGISSSAAEDPDSGSTTHSFVIEKYDSDEFPKGVFVSHWDEVKTKVGEPPFHLLDEAAGQVAPGLTMATLYDLAIDDMQVGYDVAIANCHHMAKLLFNNSHRTNLFKWTGSQTSGRRPWLGYSRTFALMSRAARQGQYARLFSNLGLSSPLPLPTTKRLPSRAYFRLFQTAPTKRTTGRRARQHCRNGFVILMKIMLL